MSGRTSSAGQIPALAGLFVRWRPASTDGAPEELSDIVRRRLGALTHVASPHPDLVLGLAAGRGGAGSVWADGPHCCVAVGEVFGDAGEPIDIARAVAAAILAPPGGGTPRLASLNGSYAAVLWDGLQEQVSLVSDRHGWWPLYRHADSRGLTASTELKALLSFRDVPRHLDAQACLEDFAFQFIMGERTLLAEVQLVPAGTVVTFGRGSLPSPQVQTYWTPTYRPEVRKAAVERRQFADLLETAVARCGSGRLAVPLSGGLDSRIVAAMAARLRLDAGLFTFGARGSQEVAIARRVAANLDVPHDVLEITPDDIGGRLHAGVWMTEGASGVNHMHSVGVLPRIRAIGPVSLHGFVGDLILGGAYLPDYAFRAGDAGELARRMWRRLNLLMPIRRINDLLAEDFAGSDVLRSSEQTMADLVAAPGAEGVADRFHRFALTQHARRFTAVGLSLNRSHLAVRLPFADRDLVDWILTVPAGRRRRHRLYIGECQLDVATTTIRTAHAGRP